jgi:flagellar biosynthesis protein FlhF
VRLKSYHSATVESAIRLAHIELGDDAVFLGSRRNDIAGGPNQAYEVTFAVMGVEDAGQDTPAGRPAAARATGRETGAARSPRTAERGNGAGARRAASAHMDNPADPQSPADSDSPRSGNQQRPENQKQPKNTARAAAVGEAAARASAAVAATGGIVSWKKFLRHVSPRDQNPRDGDAADGAAQDGAAVAGIGTEEEVRPQHADGVVGAGQNGTLLQGEAGVRAGAGARGVAALPHWREFVPGEERRAEAASQQVLLADASRVAAAGNSEGGAVRQPHPAAPRNGGMANGAATRPANKQPRGMPPPVEERTTEVYSLQKLGVELEELRRMFERQQTGGSPLVLPSRELLRDTRLAGFYHRLSDNAVEPSLASELVAGLQQASAGGAEGRRLGALLAEKIRTCFKTDSELGCPGAPRAVAALIGPSGAGKTTAVAKLAFRYGLLRRRRVRLFSVDPLRMGAVESLQAYSELMNLPFEIVDDFDKLGAALGAAGGEAEPELLLVDTPGYGRREWERARRLAAAFLERGEVDVHLVLDLRTKSEDLRRTVENFHMFRPTKLLFTRLDETTTFGTMLNETVRTGLPVSFVSVGQRVPEDIVPAGEPELLRLLLKDRSSS